MASLYKMDKGTEIELFRMLNAAGLTAEDAKKLSTQPKVVKAMLAKMREDDAFRLIHGRFTPLADKVAMVKSWPGINPDDVDAAVALVRENGTIAGFEVESPNNPLLDLVIVVYRESIPATLLYGRDRFMETFEGHYAEWAEAYASGVDDERVELIPGARKFRPNTIQVQAVDFGANWDPQRGNVLSEVQKTQGGKLADFAGLFNASQSPKWVEQMDEVNVPETILAALLLSVPHCGVRSYSPDIWRHSGGEAELGGYHIGSRFHVLSMAVVREFHWR
ncbi:MAG: hypothetical protein A2017_05390 [Lentisphaerae bacterium GWF2_44_16]|nr:MAG: hypothetical protein A2017_05390 [Lentisphaerae bacterium GWF2_44_16]HAU66583.1 hypothetical protein [Candidatus Uhrbacteria bacterium]